MILALFLFSIGILLLIKGASMLIDGASSLAIRFHVKPIVIGLTIVAFGTSAPELFVSVTGALSNNTDLALGNIIGSCIANILLVLGIGAVIHPLFVKKNTVYKEVPLFFLSILVLTVLGLQGLLDSGAPFIMPFLSDNVIGSLSLSDGLILLSFFIIFLYYTYGLSKAPASQPKNINKNITMSSIKSSLWIFLGLSGLIIGSQLIVNNAVILASQLGFSEAFIGLTLVAVGTGLPELTTTAVAAYKKQMDIAVGNIIGSNIFNILFILGITTLIKPLPLKGEILIDIYMLCASTILLYIILFVNSRFKIGRAEGFIMLSFYIFYIVYLFFRDRGIS